MLAVSYGPDWRVPDPSFRHLPSREITDRFDGWFSSVMTHRRDWTQFNGQVGAAGMRPSPFSRWVVDQLDRTADGAAIDRHPARPRRRIRLVGGPPGLPPRRFQGDRLRLRPPGQAALGGHEIDLPASVGRRVMNLLDERDVLTVGALAARQKGPKVVTARQVLEAVPPRSRDQLWRFAAMALAEGGRVYVEGVSRSPHACRMEQQRTGSPRLWPVDPHDVVDDVRASGGRVVHREGFAAAARASRTGSPARWRMIVAYAGPENSAQEGRTDR